MDRLTLLNDEVTYHIDGCAGFSLCGIRYPVETILGMPFWTASTYPICPSYKQVLDAANRLLGQANA